MVQQEREKAIPATLFFVKIMEYESCSVPVELVKE
jgi:hypothetical protein